MATLFIFISFMLNAVALFAIIVLFMRQNRLHEVKKQQEKLAAEMEEMMAAYLLEMKEENEKFINEFSASRTSAESSPLPTPAATPSKEETAATITSLQKEDPVAISAPSMQRIRAAKVYGTASSSEKVQSEEKASPSDEPEKPEDVFSLKEQGLGVEEIARKLNKGKTEVELALKFAKGGKNS